MRFLKALFVMAMLVQAFVAPGAEPLRRIAQYTHQRWSDESATPNPIFAIEQGKDGYLWVAAGEALLYRFDGVVFEKIDLEVGASKERHGSITALKVTRNGDVWAFFGLSRRFAVYRDGAFRLVPGPSAPLSNAVTNLQETPDGAIWALLPGLGQGAWRYQNGKWQQFGADDGLPRDYAFSMLVAADGALWISYYRSIVRLAPGGSRFETVRETPEANGRISQDPMGRIWFSEKGGTYAITGPKGRGSPPAVRIAYPTANPPLSGRPMFDSAGNLWLALPFGGIQRVVSPDPAGADSEADAAARVESFGVRDGLTSDVTNHVLEDREGNIWVPTEKGLDKFRAASLRVEPRLMKPRPFGDHVMSASDGSVYIGEVDAAYRVAPGGEPQAILESVPIIQAICEAPDGAVWFILVDRLAVWKSGRIDTVGKPPRIDAVVQDCAFDRHGELWATVRGSGMLRYREGKWEEMFGPVDKDKYFPSVMIRDAQQRLVVHWAPRTLSWLDPPERTSVSVDDGPETPRVLTLSSTSRGDVLAGGSFGLREFRDGRTRTITEAQGMQFRGMKGIVESPEGETWTVNEFTLARTQAQDLERAFSDPTFSPPSLKLSSDDGLPGRVGTRFGQAMARGGDGRLWIATLLGTVWMDPKNIIRNPEPPSVAIASIKVDGKLHRDPHTLTLPAAPSDIEIDYSVLSYANPKRVAMRYQLEGYDKDWIDPGGRRQAFYTNLAPGQYRFRVIGANNEGVWNKTGASLEFEIPPTFVQSRWFVVLCVALGTILLWLLYRLRVAQIAARIRSRLEERLGERERIARELHDTLLQSVQGLILRFQTVARTLPAAEPSRAMLESVLKRAGDVVVEGRDRVRDLRIADSPGDLRTLLQALADGAGFEPPIPVRVAVQGQPRPIHPLVLAEVRQIAGEALFNIARHAQANSVDVTIVFASRELQVQISDDGVGIADKVLAMGEKPDHFGLVGMRERARRIGGSLSIDSSPGSGTRVTLTLPARLAFADRTGLWSLVTRGLQGRHSRHARHPH